VTIEGAEAAGDLARDKDEDKETIAPLSDGESEHFLFSEEERLKR
jgi:hypothetical protein